MLVYAHIHTNVEKWDDKTHLINISQKKYVYTADA